MVPEFFTGLGVIGLVLVAVGMIVKKRRNQAEMFITGGVCLEMYSIFKGDWVFIVLQLVLIVVAVYEFFEFRKARRKK